MKKNKKSKFNIFALLKAIIILLFIAIIAIGFISTPTEKIEYNEFVKSVESGMVEKAKIDTSSGTVYYTLKNGDKTFETTYPYTDDFIETLLLAGVDVDPHTIDVMSYIPYFISPLFLICLLVVTYRMQAKAGNDSVVVEAPNSSFKDVAGMDEVKEDLLLLAKIMKEDTFKKAGARIPKGILLEGPPGNGKTLLARAFAGEAGVNFIAINASDMGSPFVGVGSMKIKKIFTEARKAAPCIIFIDEIDAIGAKRVERDDSASKEMNNVVTALLNQMDGFVPTDNITVIAATNRADSLDEALVRPGRFDKRLVVGLPDKQTRKELITFYANKASVDFKINVDFWANNFYNCSSSEIENIINESIIIAINKSLATKTNAIVTEDDVEEAFLKLSLKGFVKKSKTRDKQDAKITAYHEAGHAVSAYIDGKMNVSKVTIAPTTSGAGGFTVTDNSSENTLHPLSYYKSEMIKLMSGRAAEYILGGKTMEAVSFGAANDISVATNIAKQYIIAYEGFGYQEFASSERCVMEKAEKLLKDVWEIAVENAERNWKYIDVVAQELLKKETLNSEEFKKVINHAKHK